MPSFYTPVARSGGGSYQKKADVSKFWEANADKCWHPQLGLYFSDLRDDALKAADEAADKLISDVPLDSPQIQVHPCLMDEEVSSPAS